MNGCFHRGEIYHILPEENETGSEQYSGRPAIIVSNEANNKFAPTLEVVYLTTKPKKSLPTHVSIEAARFRSIALCEQIHTVAKSRIGDYIDKLSKYEVEEVDAAIVVSLGLDSKVTPTDEEKFPLLDFVKEEVPFRLKSIFNIPDEKLNKSIVDNCIWSLYDNSDVMFDYDSMDEHIREELVKCGINPDDYKEEENDEEQ